MKLRNKKTGEIATKIDISQDGESFWVLGDKPCMYKSLAELNKEWEDCKPSEPLIKDEKIREAVRAWAELLGIKTCMYDKTLNALAVGTLMINFPNELRSEMPQKEEFYTIAELCGEEEE